jgi:hypothetical protein
MRGAVAHFRAHGIHSPPISYRQIWCSDKNEWVGEAPAVCELLNEDESLMKTRIDEETSKRRESDGKENALASQSRSDGTH